MRPILIVLLAAWLVAAPAFGQKRPYITIYTLPGGCAVTLMGPNGQSLRMAESGLPWTPDITPQSIPDGRSPQTAPADADLLAAWVKAQTTFKVALQHDGYQDTTIDLPVSALQPGPHSWPVTQLPTLGQPLAAADRDKIERQCQQDLTFSASHPSLLDARGASAWRDQALFSLVYADGFSPSALAALGPHSFDAAKHTLGGKQISQPSVSALQHYCEFCKSVPCQRLFREQMNYYEALRNEAMQAAVGAGLLPQQMPAMPLYQYDRKRQQLWVRIFGQEKRFSLSPPARAALSRWLQARGDKDGVLFCSMGRDETPDLWVKMSLAPQLLEAVASPFRVQGAVSRSVGAYKLLVKPMNAAAIEAALRDRWQRSAGAIALAPLQHTVTFNTSPQGAQVSILSPSLGAVGKSGQPITLDFSTLLKNGVYLPELQVELSLAGFEKRVEPISTAWLASNDVWPRGHDHLLTPASPIGALYYNTWTAHRVLTILIPVVLLSVWWRGRRRVRGGT